MPMPFRRSMLALFAVAAISGVACARDLIETPNLEADVAAGKLPPVAQRVPAEPLVVDLAARGRTPGVHGGQIVTLVPRARDIRTISANAYSRLVGYDESLALKPDLLARVDVEDDRIFTMHLREGHRWSDGTPFTAEDFRYWWEDIANDKRLSPVGVPDFMQAGGKPPQFEVIDDKTIRYSWETPNPRFLPVLAGPRDPFIYRPAAYLKRHHGKYEDASMLDAKARRQKLRSWAALHNRLDDMNEQTNPDLPTLQAWRVATASPATRFVFERNPFYHRIDGQGRQLPYTDRVVIDTAAAGLLAAKANAGEVDLLARGLTMSDVPILKEGEKIKGYKTLLWQHARGSEIALFPNLNCADPVWRTLNRDIRFRKALSLGIDRKILNNALLFGLGVEGNNTILERSPLFETGLRKTNATYDAAAANRLLDEIGLTKRDGSGIRLLPDGRLLEIVVETDGETSLIVDGLTLIGEFWREIGVKLFVKPQDRTILRNRSFAGLTVMVAAQGLDNAVPTPLMSPAELAPLWQAHYSWPKWGQYAETQGKAGEPVDLAEAKELLDLFGTWMTSSSDEAKARAWTAMLKNHAANQWSIGTVAGAIQPVVVKNGLLNLPATGFYSWEPTAMLGIYRIDELFWGEAARREAMAR
jgi:peptide/nickel transport system substrate-binding protein